MITTPRIENPAQHLPVVGEIAAAVNKVNAEGVLPQALVTLVQLRVGQLVGSSYVTARQIQEAEDTPERLGAVATWRTAPYFTDAERAALALAEAVHTPNPTGPRVSDELFEEARQHLSDRELVVLTGVLGQIGYFLPLALIGSPKVGVPLAEQWTK
ncbi:carboxymuconolactone decarboxylase family protein [Glycomyces sp. TRM65418]|uniref:carboxymuconolactone decarboxylase family protein n=1 Tax=Glycomyces sp. TRM65418 TaxID=2867006 RepID=UPI001CE62974|nr:carboxymuconolactone decarboxylase family protein [Glycomyces sp. TRM65418]MCC3764762.1 carboxymuconolactone decarboxylase family protein [Glycomyces sp. TRM65418]QZD54416.1 carboxymuconolactone decarboxylase family protein [Glycomyces sp. TRM65418]